jgi:DNA-binding response OmpR family regulator
MARILLASGEESLRRTRQLILEQAGYEVVSALGVAAALRQCADSTFDLLVIGHSIPDEHKRTLVDTFRRSTTAPIVCITPSSGCPVKGVDSHIETLPEFLVAAVHDFIPHH